MKYQEAYKVLTCLEAISALDPLISPITDRMKSTSSIRNREELTLQRTELKWFEFRIPIRRAYFLPFDHFFATTRK